MSPVIGEVKTYAVGFWQSQLCDNSLAGFPSGIDFSWGNLGFEVDGADSDNFAEIVLSDENGNIFQTIKFDSNGKKITDLSQYSNISSTQDVYVIIKITAFV